MVLFQDTMTHHLKGSVNKGQTVLYMNSWKGRVKVTIKKTPKKHVLTKFSSPEEIHSLVAMVGVLSATPCSCHTNHSITQNMYEKLFVY